MHVCCSTAFIWAVVSCLSTHSGPINVWRSQGGQFAGFTSLTLLVLNFSSGSVPSRFCSPSICVWFAPEFGLCGALFFVTHGFLHYVQSERCYCISGAQTLETGHSRLPRSVMVISSLCVPAPEWSVSRAWSLRQWFTFYNFCFSGLGR